MSGLIGCRGERQSSVLSCEWCGEESFRSSIPQLLGSRPCGPRLPGAEPPGSAGSTCACHLNGLPKPPVFFRLARLPNALYPKQYGRTDRGELGGVGLRRRQRPRVLQRSQKLFDLQSLRIRHSRPMPSAGVMSPQARTLGSWVSSSEKL